MFALETKKISKKFDGVHAVNALSIGFEKGKITGLIGPNGSGKTTLMNTLTGMYPSDGGSTIISGVSYERIRPFDVSTYGITRTFQDVRLFEQMTVLDNLLVVLTERGVFRAFFERHKKHHASAAESILKRVGLLDKKNQLARNLSYGQRKLLELSRVMAMDRDIILFDEIFAGLFPEMVKQVKEIVLEMKAAGKTIIIIEHDMALIRELSDHVFVLESGKLLAEGSPSKVLGDSKVKEAYLGV